MTACSFIAAASVPRTTRGLALAAVALLLCSAMSVATVAHAAPPVADPTRPAVSAEPAASSVAVRRGEAAPAALPASAPAAPQLQSVQLAPNGGSTALVDGRLLRVGSRIGERTISAIDEQGLWLRGGREAHRMSLHPGVTKVASGTVPSTLRPATTVATTKVSP